ncbi:MAG: hypothetical protein KJ063_02225 [Anaerolineae bacterium]|nr:hypothetical protein [Anaerolineae bacterium]
MSKFANQRILKLDARFSIGTETANAIPVSIQLKDRENGNELGERAAVHWYLSSNANGDVVASAPSGGIAIGTDGVLIEWTNNVSGMAISEADGDIDVVITDTGTPTFYLVLVMPDGKLAVSGPITFA